MKHPTPSQLNDFQEGRLDTRHRWAIADHLQACESCRAEAEALQQVQDSLDLLDVPTTGHPAEEDLALVALGQAEPELRQRVLLHLGECPECATIFGQLPRERRSTSRLMAWLGSATAAAAVALVVVFMLHQSPGMKATDHFPGSGAMPPAVEREAATASEATTSPMAEGKAATAEAMSAAARAAGGASRGTAKETGRDTAPVERGWEAAGEGEARHEVVPPVWTLREAGRERSQGAASRQPTARTPRESRRPGGTGYRASASRGPARAVAGGRGQRETLTTRPPSSTARQTDTPRPSRPIGADNRAVLPAPGSEGRLMTMPPSQPPAQAPAVAGAAGSSRPVGTHCEEVDAAGQPAASGPAVQGRAGEAMTQPNIKTGETAVTDPPAPASPRDTRLRHADPAADGLTATTPQPLSGGLHEGPDKAESKAAPATGTDGAASNSVTDGDHSEPGDKAEGKSALIQGAADEPGSEDTDTEAPASPDEAESDNPAAAADRDKIDKAQQSGGKDPSTSENPDQVTGDTTTNEDQLRSGEAATGAGAAARPVSIHQATADTMPERVAARGTVRGEKEATDDGKNRPMEKGKPEAGARATASQRAVAASAAGLTSPDWSVSQRSQSAVNLAPADTSSGILFSWWHGLLSLL
jgi:hypothetical protein